METLKLIIIMLFTITVLMVGLIETINSFKESSRTDDLKNISINPENYINKEIVVVGKVYKPTVLFDNRENGIRYAIYQEDKNSFYTINLYSYNGEVVEQGYYRIKGIINYVDVCNCQYRCIDFRGDCVNTSNYLYSPHDTIRNFRTNLTSNPIKDYWYISFYYYSRIITYLCPVSTKDYFECSYEKKKEFDVFKFEWQRLYGIFYKEYRCEPDSLERIYYIEATEPVAKI